MLQPRKTKFRYQFRGKMRGLSLKGNRLNFSDLGLKALERGWLTSAQIEAARKAITQFTKRKARIWIRIFPDKPVTKKGSGVTMGGGKGEIDFWVAVVKPGKILFEIGGAVTKEIMRLALERAAAKLPIKTKVIEEEF